MTRVLAILRKDLRRLWPHVLIFNGLLLAGALTDPTYTHIRPSFATSMIWDVSVLACWILAIAVIHEERLVGDRQCWLTQPYTRGGLLAAKALFLLLTVNLPLLVMHATVGTAVGIPLPLQVTALLWRQVFITAFIIMPAATLAVVTRSLKQVVLLLLAIVVPLVGLSFLLSMTRRIPALLLSPAWNADYWLKAAFAAFAALVFGTTVLCLQYFRRATVPARLALGTGAACCLLASILAPESMQFAVQELLSERCAGCGAARAELDSRAGRANLTFSRERRSPRVVHAAIPIRIEGVPSGLEILSAQRPAELWCMGRKFNAIVDERPPGERWLSLDVDGAFFSEYAESTVDLRGAIQLTLLAQIGSLAAPMESRVAVPGIGVCSQEPASGASVWLICHTPARQRALALEFPGGGRQWIVTRSSAAVPSPTSSQFAPLEKFSSQTAFASASELGRLRLVAERPKFHLRVPFHVKGITLKAYRHR